jgi:hypothetical protein
VELALNLVWAVLAILGWTCWLRADKPENVSKSTQVIALAMLALLLFPVISVTDDFRAAQNPAEADSSVRRNDLQAYQHTIAPEIAVATRMNAELPLVFLGHTPPGEGWSGPAPQIFVQSSPFTRPPPAV